MTLPPTYGPGRQTAKLAGVLAATILVAVAMGLALRLGAREQVIVLLDWIEGQGVLGMAIFLLVQIAIVVLLLPGMVMTMGAGFLFGVVRGSGLMLAGTTIGATIAFFLARHGLEPWVRKHIEQRPRLKGLDRAISEQGWKVILITRLIPFFPFKLSNYVFGLMQVDVRDLILGTLIGCIPLTVITVYAGSLAADLATLQPDVLEHTPWQWLPRAIGFLVMAVLVIWIASRASRYYQATFRQEPPS